MDHYRQINSIQKQLFSRRARFHKNPSLILDRLDNVTKLLKIRETELIVGQEVNRLVIAGFERIKALSKQLRGIILHQAIDTEESKLLRKLLLNQDQLSEIQDFRYVIAHEWPTYQIADYLEEHRGDLVLMNEDYGFAVIELKHIKIKDEYSPQGKARKTFACKQARKFQKFFQRRFPWANVTSFAVTNLGTYHPMDKNALVQSVKLIFSEADELILR